MNIKKLIIILIHAFVLWMLCATTMGIGIGITTLYNTLIIHAIMAPIFAIAISTIYFKKFSYTTALQTAIVFVVFIILMDLLVVALLINKSLDMFESILGTWIPFALIFFATYVTGQYVKKHS